MTSADFRVVLSIDAHIPTRTDETSSRKRRLDDPQEPRGLKRTTPSSRRTFRRKARRNKAKAIAKQRLLLDPEIIYENPPWLNRTPPWRRNYVARPVPAPLPAPEIHGPAMAAPQMSRLDVIAAWVNNPTTPHPITALPKATKSRITAPGVTAHYGTAREATGVNKIPVSSSRNFVGPVHGGGHRKAPLKESARKLGNT
ncbi:hypothetical protein MBLNU459_g0389t1 [Dothideomycetes sp. NU459]